jgi:UDP-N-acetylmuramoylalanine--D-glutamate ligase
MELAGKKILVIGLARTGRECVRFLARQGARVWVSDLRGTEDLQAEITNLAGVAVTYRLGGEDASWLDGVDAVIPSPGVPQENLLLQGARARGISILSEIELAYRFFTVPLAAITGTNGKSTTTTLLGEMIRASGRKVFLGGNLGVPLVGALAQEWDWAVVEISSFQLEWTTQFRPRIAVLLNITEDHLDRYPSFADYCAAKARIFAAQNGDDVAILNRDDPLVWKMRDRIKARVVSFGFAETPAGVFTAGGGIVWRDGADENRFSLGRTRLQGVHNLENMMAAVAAAKSAGVEPAMIQQVLDNFPGLEHRLEFIREKGGVRYYNDSKGTNVGAVVKSLASFTEPVILLAGGVDKGGDYAPLKEGVRRKVRRLVLFGAAREIIARALGGFTETVLVEDIQAAVRDASAHARAGDVVLLSPACSSFDQFRNYAERGKVFKDLVQQL